MPYNEQLANRVREALMDEPIIEEKKMFQGVCFLVDNKMCVCVSKDSLLCRIGEQQAHIELEKGNCTQMINNGRVMKDFVYVDETEVQTGKGLNYWITLCLAFNPLAKASKKK
jgi:TfoX/Sxy family transcriptional regulator of competence genes